MPYHPLAVQECSGCRQRTPHPCDDVDGTHVGVLFHAAEASAEAGHDAQRGLHVVVIAQMLSPGATTLAGPTPSIEADEDGPRVHLLQGGWAQAKALQALRGAVHHNHITACHECSERCLAAATVLSASLLCRARVLQVEQNGALAGVRCQAIDNRHLRRVHGSRGVHLHDLRTETGQHRTDRGAGDDVCEVKHPDTLKPSLAALCTQRVSGVCRGLQR
mmetsp:Transcript_148057/g.369089  ORF Transcript_148057/g.369089 Transcript_148057/m.369089 type:complete len:219 (-) Transcript_148057:1602-2258(-)